MGFKKTEKGNVIYEFDFMPTKLVPIKSSESGYDRSYIATDDAGHKTPFYFEYQGCRHGNYALAFGIMNNQDSKRFGNDICVCSNICIVATFAKMCSDYDASYDEASDDFKITNPADTDILADAEKVFEVMSVQDAEIYLGKKNIPTCGYDILKQRMA